MPWKATSVLEERIKFVVLASRGEWTMVELCREFGINRQTGHERKQRYALGGAQTPPLPAPFPALQRKVSTMSW